MPEYLEYWARIKGLNVIGTGDCVHPGWLAELKQKLAPADNGFFVLKDEYRLKESSALAGSAIPGQIYFLLTGEISSIYKRDGKTRKVHNVCVFPDFASVERIAGRLSQIGNISADGRPILGLDARNLLEMTLSTSDKSWLLPAHIWTPWFSALGSKSGFDSIEECYGDLTSEIFAVETGLSSDPPMNRLCSFLDRFKLVSNSDAHSPEKLGREANLFDCELSYDGVLSSLKGNSGFDGTIEFFPQEGKYHYDGHRKCGVRLNPLETAKNGGLCPVCGKPLTLGVMHRVAQLADRDDASSAPGKKLFYSIAALPEIIAELRGVKNSGAAAVQTDYFQAIKGLGSEFGILLFADLEDIRSRCGDMLAEGIRRLRAGDVAVEEGYDGEFGRVKLFRKEEKSELFGKGLFAISQTPPAGGSGFSAAVDFSVSEFKALSASLLDHIDKNKENKKEAKDMSVKGSTEISPEQRQGISHGEGPCMVIAGPGTGKTFTLTQRIISLIKSGRSLPSQILAVTFSNNAAEEMLKRVKREIGGELPQIMTFHAFGLSLLKKYFAEVGRREDFILIDEQGAEQVLADIAGVKAAVGAKQIDAYKRGGSVGTPPPFFDEYETTLVRINAFDLNDLIRLPTKLLAERSDICKEEIAKFKFVLADEFQDINAAQYELLKLIAPPPAANLFVIGDPHQSIYSFRGASPAFAESFIRDFPRAKQITLGKSFRCPSPVLQAAAQVLQQGQTASGADANIKINISGFASDASEAEHIARTIESMMGGVRSFSIDSGIADGTAVGDNTNFSDFAVLCRSSFMFAAVEKALQNHGIPYKPAGTGAFYAEGKPRQTLEIISNLVYKKSSVDIPTEIARLAEENDKPATLVRAVMKHIGGDKTETKRLANAADRYKTVGDMLTAFMLRVGEDDFPYDYDAVALMTIHAAKGLEFCHVFIPGCEDGIMPFSIFGKDAGYDISEEKRVFYVAATRTSRNLFLSYAARRNFRGRQLNLKPSPFIARIKEELLLRHIQETKQTNGSEDQLNLF